MNDLVEALLDQMSLAIDIGPALIRMGLAGSCNPCLVVQNVALVATASLEGENDSGHERKRVLVAVGEQALAGFAVSATHKQETTSNHTRTKVLDGSTDSRRLTSVISQMESATGKLALETSSVDADRLVVDSLALEKVNFEDKSILFQLFAMLLQTSKLRLDGKILFSLRPGYNSSLSCRSNIKQALCQLLTSGAMTDAPESLQVGFISSGTLANLAVDASKSSLVVDVESGLASCVLAGVAVSNHRFDHFEESGTHSSQGSSDCSAKNVNYSVEALNDTIARVKDESCGELCVAEETARLGMMTRIVVCGVPESLAGAVTSSGGKNLWKDVLQFSSLLSNPAYVVFPWRNHAVWLGLSLASTWPEHLLRRVWQFVSPKTVNQDARGTRAQAFPEFIDTRAIGAPPGHVIYPQINCSSIL